MNVIEVGTSYRIYGDAIKTHQQLPAEIFEVQFSMTSGFFLELAHDIEIKEEKIYGVHHEKLAKVKRGFSVAERNFGIILSGDKGMGKSLFAKLLAKDMKAAGLPVILVNSGFPGVSGFLESIEQEVVVIFDEFEKTFRQGKGEDSNNEQDEFLTLLDGFSTGKKLFAITCNRVEELSSYFVNRTGRFHYHFNFAYPNYDEVREYCIDKLDDPNETILEQLASYTSIAKINYDCLRAICFELNQGYEYKEVINDLNVPKVAFERYAVVIEFADGTASQLTERFDMFANLQFFGVGMNTSDGKDWMSGRVEFNPKTITWDYRIGIGTTSGVNVDPARFTWYDDDQDKYVEIEKEVAKITFKKAGEY